jgi:hypothetical protein
MTKIITTLLLLAVQFIFSQSQFEIGMKEAFDLWGKGENKEASALFERIASAETNNWLPYYYASMVEVTSAFSEKDKEKMKNKITKAQELLDNLVGEMQNDEVLVIQAMIYTAWITYDPMNNGMKYSGLAGETYRKAKAINPKNPRAIFGNAELDMGTAKFFGQDTKHLCVKIEEAVAIFKDFKPESPFHPKWGKERAEQALANCNK